MRGFQLWINLPAANKMDAPEYQEYRSDAFPVVETPDYTVKVLIGRFGDADAPIVDNITDVSYFDVQRGKTFSAWTASRAQQFFICLRGEWPVQQANNSIEHTHSTGH